MENVPSTQSAYIVSHLRYSGRSPFGVRSGNEGDDGMVHDLRRLIHDRSGYVSLSQM